MIITMAGGLVSGGWDALTNITSGIGKGISQLGSSFFPAPQRTAIQSEITKPAGGTGATFRPTAIEAPSIWESQLMAAQEWINTPYEAQYAVQSKVSESQHLAQTVSAVKQEGIGGMFADIMRSLEWAAGQKQKITTLVDEVTGPWAPRETIRGVPQAGYPEGRDEQNLNNLAQRGAEVYQTAKTAGQAILDQVKGLFNLGFPQQGSQPVFGIKHELTPSKGLTTGLIIAGVILVLVILFARRK